MPYFEMYGTSGHSVSLDGYQRVLLEIPNAAALLPQRKYSTVAYPKSPKPLQRERTLTHLFL